MQKDVTRLARELRKETCPRRVIDEATRRIAAETPSPSRLRYALPVALAVLLVLGGFMVQRRLAGGNAGRPPRLAEQHAVDRAQIARQAEGAFALIGAVLRDAAAHSETVITDRAVPPLQNGLESFWQKIIHQKTEL